jgi:excisionase family DNA binding protein
MSTVVSLDDARRRRTLATTSVPGRAAAAVVAGQRLLRDRELAEILGVSRYTIRNYRRAGMPAHPIGGTGFRFILEDVLTWLAERHGGVDDAPRATA